MFYLDSNLTCIVNHIFCSLAKIIKYMNCYNCKEKLDKII